MTRTIGSSIISKRWWTSLLYTALCLAALVPSGVALAWPATSSATRQGYAECVAQGDLCCFCGESDPGEGIPGVCFLLPSGGIYDCEDTEPITCHSLGCEPE